MARTLILRCSSHIFYITPPLSQKAMDVVALRMPRKEYDSKWRINRDIWPQIWLQGAYCWHPRVCCARF